MGVAKEMTRWSGEKQKKILGMITDRNTDVNTN